MDPLSQLPPECLLLIISHFYHNPPESNKKNLSPLLFTNKHISSVARSFLYSNPFRDAYHIRPNCSDPAAVTGFLLTRTLLRHPRPNGGGGELALPKVLSMALTISDTYVEKSEEEAMEEYWEYKRALLWGPKPMELESGSEDWEEEDSWNSESDADDEREVQQSGAVGGTSSIAGDEVVAEQEPDTKEPSADMDVNASSADTNVNTPSAKSDDDQDSGQNATPVTPSSFDYLGHVRHLDMQKWSIDMEQIWPEEGKTHYSTTFRQYVEQDKDEQQRRVGTRDRSLRCLYHDLLYQEATWALANPILEQLLSLCIPILDVGRYLGVASRFGHLEKVLFTKDNLNEDSESLKILPAGDVFDPAGNRLQQLFRTTVAFVKEHARLFPGRLKTATISDRFHRSGPHNDSRRETQFEIFQILPPLRGVKELTESNWPQFLVHPLTTDVSHVEMISEAPKDRIDHGKLLQRCWSLRILDTTMPGKGAFKWAVEEKQQMLSVGGNTTGEDYHNLGVHLQESSRPDNVQHCLVPLTEVFLREKGETTLLTDELDDIAFAFSQTLQALALILTRRTSLPRQIHIGQGWVDLPKLSELSIVCDGARFVIDGLFNHCPHLVSVVVRDNTREYRCQDIVPCAAAKLAKVTSLRLTGWSALTFNPATLHSTKRLGSLIISMDAPVEEGLYIPPVQELNRSYGIVSDRITTASESAATPAIVRPAWTWDWYLPHLWSLVLRGEFAFLFQFRMVQGCPKLYRLDLSIRSEGVTHTRILSSSELYSTSTPSSNDPTAATATATASSSSLAVRERIVAPQIRVLALHGDWVSCDMTLRQFAKRIFPRVDKFTHEV